MTTFNDQYFFQTQLVNPDDMNKFYQNVADKLTAYFPIVPCICHGVTYTQTGTSNIFRFAKGMIRFKDQSNPLSAAQSQVQATFANIDLADVTVSCPDASGNYYVVALLTMTQVSPSQVTFSATILPTSMTLAQIAATGKPNLYLPLYRITNTNGVYALSVNSNCAVKPYYSLKLEGEPTAPTAAAGTNTNQLATTAFANGVIPKSVAVQTASGGVGNNNMTRILYPSDAYYNNSYTSGVNAIGAICITLPDTIKLANTMLKMYVNIYPYYNATATATVCIAGYWGNGYWSSTNATITSGSTTANYPISFGVTALGVPCIYIGEVTTDWSLIVRVSIDNLLASYTSATIANLSSGWNIDIVQTINASIYTQDHIDDAVSMGYSDVPTLGAPIVLNSNFTQAKGLYNIDAEGNVLTQVSSSFARFTGSAIVYPLKTYKVPSQLGSTLKILQQLSADSTYQALMFSPVSSAVTGGVGWARLYKYDADGLNPTYKTLFSMDPDTGVVGFSYIPTAPTAPTGTNTNQLATTAFANGVTPLNTKYDFIVTGDNTPTFAAGEEYILYPSYLGGYVEFELTFLGRYITGSTNYGEVTAKFSIEYNVVSSYNSVNIKMLSISQSGISQNLTNLFTFTTYLTTAPYVINGVTLPIGSMICTIKLNNALTYSGTTNSIFAKVSSNALNANIVMNDSLAPVVLGIVSTPIPALAMTEEGKDEIVGATAVIKADNALFQSSMDPNNFGTNPTTGLTQIAPNTTAVNKTLHSTSSSVPAWVQNTVAECSDYVTGTFAPVFGGGTTAGTYTPTGLVATYTKIGNLVTLFCSVGGFTAASGGVGTFKIRSGLPFQPVVATNPSVGSITYGGITLPTNDILSFVVLNSGSIGFVVNHAGALAGLNPALITTTSTFGFTITYKIA